MNKIFISIYFFFVFTFFLSAQESEKEAAIELTRNNRFEKALAMFDSLKTDYSRDARYNFYKGICLVELVKDVNAAEEMLTFSLNRGNIRSSYFYLAKAKLVNLQIEKAKEYANLFDRRGRFGVVTQEQFDQLNSEIEKLESMAREVDSIRVLEKEQMSASKFHTIYSLPDYSGKITTPGKVFPGYNAPDSSLLYLNEKEDRIIFVSPADSANLDLYESFRLLNGSWDNPSPMDSVINSEYDEAYPYLLADGLTLYFSSKGHGSIGGYDIFKSRYNPSIKAWSEPENMGIPINSAYDELMFAPVAFDHYAYFASDRFSEPGQVWVYKIEFMAEYPKKTQTGDNALLQALQLNVNGSPGLSAKKQDDIPDVQQNRSGKPPSEVTQKQKSGKEPFFFPLNSNLAYRQYEDFNSQEALRLFKKGQSIEFHGDSLKSRLTELRENYESMQNQVLKEALSKEIIETESSFFSFNEDPQPFYDKARKMELEFLEAHPEALKPLIPDSVKAAVQKFRPLDELKITDEHKSIFSLKEGVSMIQLQNKLRYFNLKLNLYKTNVLYNDDEQAVDMIHAGVDSLTRIRKDQLEIIRNHLSDSMQISAENLTGPGLSQKLNRLYKLDSLAHKALNSLDKSTAVLTPPDEESYRIQLGIFKNSLRTDIASEFQPIIQIPLEEEGLTKYLGGAYQTYEEAQRAKQRAIELGCNGAFVIHYNNGDITKAEE